MKLTIASAVVLLALVGCATDPSKGPVEVNKLRPAAAASAAVVQEEQEPLNEQCAALAKTARAIAALRDAGVNKTDVQFLVAPSKDYPMDPMAREVYARTDISPAAGATNSYGVCVKVGYGVMVAALKDAQVKFEAAEAQRAKDELAAKKKPAAKPAAKPAKVVKPS